MITMTSDNAGKCFLQLLESAGSETIQITRDGESSVFLISAQEMKALLEIRAQRTQAIAELEAWKAEAERRVTREQAQAAETLQDDDIVRRPQSVPYLALHKAFRTAELCGCSASIRELEEVLMRDKFDPWQNRTSRIEFLEFLLRHMRRIEVAEEVLKSCGNRCRDPKDEIFLALAAVAEARWLVSSDQDLLVLHPWKAISILTPADFLRADN